ncbi:MAG: DUF4340 domain-containing protein [Limisphaerales bacterium]
MQKKLTWILTMLAVVLFAFIYFFERKVPGSAERNTPPRLVAIEPQDVTALEITLPGGGVVRAEQTNGVWFLTKPRYPAEQSIIETFVTNVVRLRRFDKMAQHEVVIEGQKSFGLDPPQATVQVEAATNSIQFDVGGNAPLTSNIYLRLLPSSEVVLTQPDLLQTLPRDTNAWRSKRLLPLANLTFDHLRVRAGQRSFELGRNSTNQLWQITRPIPARADQNQVSALLEVVGRAQVGRFVGDGLTQLDPFGLQMPEIELGLSQGTNRVYTVEFGAAATNDTNQVFARLLGYTNVVTVPRELLDVLKLPYKAFHDPRLFTMEQVSALDRVEVKFLEEFALQRQVDGRWFLGETNRQPVDMELLGEFLTKIFALRILDIAKEVPAEADLQALGLRQPIASFSLFLRVTNSPGNITNVLYSQLSFGTNTAGRIYVSRSDETPVYITEFAKFLELPRFAYELRDRQIWSFATSSVVRVSIASAAGTNSAVRTAAGWLTDPLANEAIGEAVFRMSNLKALRWVAKGEERKQSLGIVPGAEVLEVELKMENGTEVWRIPLGKLTMRRDVYAEHPQTGALIFEFPGEIYHLLKQNLPAAK